MSKKEKSENKDCFVIMPISDCEGYEKGHFNKVYEDIFKVAITNAGYIPIRADEVKQTNLIHLDILQKLLDSPLAICDLSTRNPNVLFELGLRQAFDKPTVLVQETGTPKIFDISPLRYTEYRQGLKYRDVLADQKKIEEAISATVEATNKGEGINSIVSILSLSNPASLKEISQDDTGRIIQLLRADIDNLRNDIQSKGFSNQKEDKTEYSKAIIEIVENKVSMILDLMNNEAIANEAVYELILEGKSQIKEFYRKSKDEELKHFLRIRDRKLTHYKMRLREKMENTDANK